MDGVAVMKQPKIILNPPEIPELPPGFQIELDRETKEWWIRNTDGPFDGLDEYPTDRARAVELAWELFLNDVGSAWRKFFSHHRIKKA